MTKRPVLKYYGSGWRRAPWIVEHFPEHDSYVEPCFGAGNVLFRKWPSKLETVNDIDNRVVNFFCVLREQEDDLVKAITLTPWAKAEYVGALETADDPLEEARRFYFSGWASIKGGPYPGPSDFRWQKRVTRRSAAVRDIANLDHLYAAAERLKNVQILNIDALELIQRVLGTDALIYFDPPYLFETRSRKSNGYRYEVNTPWHKAAAELLRSHDGPVVVSGYQSALYESEYEAYGWLRKELPVRTNSGGTAVECIWINPLVQEMSKDQVLNDR